MTKHEIRSVKDVCALKYVYDSYDEVTIHANAIKQLGILRHGLKYAYYALRSKGVLRVKDEPLKSFSFQTRRIDFWQVRNEVFKVIQDGMRTVEVNNETGEIILQKQNEQGAHTGISFGIVFSGSNAEEGQLIQVVESILQNQGIGKARYEVIICGPGDYMATPVIEKYPEGRIKYLKYDLLKGDRLLITEKKNFLFEQSAYDIVCISHTRIHYPTDFVNRIMTREFDVVAPKVVYRERGRTYKYLDYGLIGSYDVARRNLLKTLAGDWIDDKYLYYFRRRVPFVDGGIMIFNKGKLKASPFNPFLAWGEAEDVDVCSRLYFQGYLMDYFDDIVCTSKTNKLTIRTSLLSRVVRNGMRQLVRCGIV